jgi:predicted Zn-dependent peptidase
MHYIIQNIVGIDCLFVPNNQANSVTIEILSKAGSIYEQAHTNGISHFLEHMFFKWGKKYPTPKSVAAAVDRFGGQFNAYTGDEYAGYYVKAAPQFLRDAVDVLGDMMIDPQFPLEELEREKGVVIQEIKMYEDNPQRLVYDKWQRYFYGDNSYGWSTLGPEENIKSFSQDMLFAHKQSLYSKDNIVITVAGRIDDMAWLQAQIADIFANLPSNRTMDKPLFTQYNPTEKVAFYDKWTEQNHLIIAAEWLAGTNDARYVATVLSTILGGNMSSRLFQNIREKQGLCYYIGARHYTSYDHGVFFIRAGIDKERFDFGLEKIFDEIAAVATGDISDEEFSDAVGNSIGKLQMGIESSDDMASFFWMQHLIYGQIETLDDQVASFAKVSKREVQDMASMLLKDKLSLYYIK